MSRRRLALAAFVLVLAAPAFGWGHAERDTLSPPRPGSRPDQKRTPTVVLDVCKTAECAYVHIQAAVNAAPNGALIRIWPGTYREEPSRARPSLPPDGDDGTYTYEHHINHPNSQNLIAIVGKKNITLRGMGAKPKDVVIDVEFKKHVGIRADRADGVIIENLSVWHAFDHGVYVLDLNGYVIDRVHSAYSREYGFLMFATDHGILKNCEAVGAGDAGIYPGGTADAPGLGRITNEVAFCRSHHNVLGYSGTQGDNVLVRNSEFFDNAIGLTSDSETDHPNYPQNNLTLRRNKFFDNNFNVYAADSDIIATVFVDEITLPVGVGVFLASGNNNVVDGNWFWDHDKFGVWLASGQAVVIGPTSDPPAPPFVSSGNVFTKNKMYSPPPRVDGNLKNNAVDFGWDGLGLDNCWSGNVRSPSGTPATGDTLLPACPAPTVGVPNPANLFDQASLLIIEGESICGNLGTCPWGPGPSTQNARNHPDGYQPPPTPPTCGPSTC